jgi:hypothetical protein
MYEETLYQTDKPEKNKSECYELSVKTIPGLMGERVWAFREFHGWWNDVSKEYEMSRTTINTEEEGITLEEAHHLLNETKAHLERNGFVHSFSPDYEGRGNGQHVYELLVPKSSSIKE